MKQYEKKMEGELGRGKIVQKKLVLDKTLTMLKKRELYLNFFFFSNITINIRNKVNKPLNSNLTNEKKKKNMKVKKHS